MEGRSNDPEVEVRAKTNTLKVAGVSDASEIVNVAPFRRAEYEDDPARDTPWKPASGVPDVIKAFAERER